MPSNRAAWLTAAKERPLQVKEAPYPTVSSQDILIKVHAWAVNPIDQIVQAQGSSLSYPWLKYPLVLGYDTAGEVVEIGPEVTRFKPGDRVFGLAYGCEKSETDISASKLFPRSGFQEYVLLSEHMTAAIPEGISYAQASVIPLGLSTAACGLFRSDQLSLQRPSLESRSTGETVLIWGGSSSVGVNAIQLAVAAGYEVITTCSPGNFGLVKQLGASQAFDYRSASVVQDIVLAFEDKICAGAFTTGIGAAEKAYEILPQVKFPKGRKKHIAMATYPMPDPVPTTFVLPKTVLNFVSFLAAAWWKKVTRGIKYKFIWGGDCINDGIGKELFSNFISQALEQGGKYVCSPEPMIVGEGVESLQKAIDVLAKGVSAKKVIVTV